MDDVIVVGGRCSGAPTAMLLARAGFKVRVVEQSSELGDTLSGHMVKPAGTTRLQAWGLFDAVLETGAPPVRSGRGWLAGQPIGELPSMASSDEPAGQGSATVAPAIAPRRGALDPVLLEGARQAGATVDMGNSVRGLLTEGSRVTGVGTDRGEYRARLVIGADGRNSRVARLAGAAKYIDNSPATYHYYTYWKGATVSGFCAFLDGGSFIGMFPTNDDLTMVFFQAPHAGFNVARRSPTEHYLAVLKAQPAAMEFLAGAAPVEPVRGTGDLPTFFRVSAGPGWALVGDAGHHKDPLIARGMADAFWDAELITAAITSGWDGDLDRALADYTTQRDACARPLSAANDSVASGIGSVPLGALAEALGGLEKLEGAIDPPSAIAARANGTTRNNP
jgi:2-polyprenyl-6-methoxyphenol hydroxylase-like FAD-dependent oxidoreductase